MTTELMQYHTTKHRNVLNMQEWRNATHKSRHMMERRQIKMNRVVKRLCHTKLLSAARRVKMIRLPDEWE